MVTRRGRSSRSCHLLQFSSLIFSTNYTERERERQMEKGGDEHDHLEASIAVEESLGETTSSHSFPRRNHKDDEGRFLKALRVSKSSFTFAFLSSFSTTEFNLNISLFSSSFVLIWREKELKDLHSQLHHAADYCDTAFRKTEQKNTVLENTKNYVRAALIAVVDHLGNVSSKLEESLDVNKEMVQAEQRMDCLYQRILTCQQYRVGLDLSNMQWNVQLPRFQHRYVLLLNQHRGKSNELLRSEAKENSEVHEATKEKDQLELRFPTHAAGLELAEAVPVLDKPPLLPRSWDQSYYKFEDSSISPRSSYRKKTAQVNNFMSLLRVTKRKK